MIHRHDYEMKFRGTGLDYWFECSCGDIRTSMNEARERQGRMEVEPWMLGLVVAVATLVTIGVIWVTS